MTIYDKILEEAAGYTAGVIRDIAVGSKITAVETDSGIGLAFVTSPVCDTVSEYIGKPVKELAAQYINGNNGLRIAALAAINSVLTNKHKGEPDDKSWAEKLNGKKRLAMVGCFTPVLKELEEAGIEVVVFEIADMPGTHRPEEAAELMPGCDAVMMTGATFSNHTAHTYFPYISPSAEAYISGPSTPCSEALMKRFTLASSVVKQKEPVFEAVRAGKCVNCISPYLEKTILRKIQ